MEHPDKKLFDDTKALRTHIEEFKERVLKLENDYEQKVIYLEKRGIINERTEKKLESFLIGRKNRILVNVSGKDYFLLHTTLRDNIYQLKNVEEIRDRWELELSKEHFKGLCEILRKGHDAFKSDTKKLSKRESGINEWLQRDLLFAQELSKLFEEKSFDELATDFQLNHRSGQDIPTEELFTGFDIGTIYTANCDDFKANNIQEVVKPNPSAPKALFLGYNSHLTINLSRTVRTNKLYLRPFIDKISYYAPTQGSTFVSIFTSVDGEKWVFQTVIPSSWGNSQNNYFCTINFDTLISFNRIKFQTGSTYFSLSYFGFSPMMQDKNAKKK
jgi:hypothetical protein